MCESNAYIRRGDDGEELLLGDVAKVTTAGGFITLEGILGNRITVRAELVEFDLMGHRLVLRELR